MSTGGNAPYVPHACVAPDSHPAIALNPVILRSNATKDLGSSWVGCITRQNPFGAFWNAPYVPHACAGRNSYPAIALNPVILRSNATKDLGSRWVRCITRQNPFGAFWNAPYYKHSS